MGCRRSMEDASVCVEDAEVTGLLGEGCPVAFYGVFDGHGGTAAAQYVSQHLVPNITADPSFVKDPAKAMVSAHIDRPLPLPPKHFFSLLLI